MPTPNNLTREQLLIEVAFLNRKVRELQKQSEQRRDLANNRLRTINELKERLDALGDKGNKAGQRTAITTERTVKQLSDMENAVAENERLRRENTQMRRLMRVYAPHVEVNA